MTRLSQVVTLIFPLYLAIVLLTGVSLTGFWTDVVFSLVLSFLALITVFRSGSDKPNPVIKIVNAICVTIVLSVLTINILDPFSLDKLKLRSFHFLSVNGRLFNAYFKPVGAYSGGYGNFWITETPKYLPLIEWQVYYKHALDYDLNDDLFEGQPVDNNEVARNYVREYVIKK